MMIDLVNEMNNLKLVCRGLFYFASFRSSEKRKKSTSEPHAPNWMVSLTTVIILIVYFSYYSSSSWLRLWPSCLFYFGLQSGSISRRKLFVTDLTRPWTSNFQRWLSRFLIGTSARLKAFWEPRLNLIKRFSIQASELLQSRRDYVCQICVWMGFIFLGLFCFIRNNRSRSARSHNAITAQSGSTLWIWKLKRKEN